MGGNLYSGKPWSEMDITDLERLAGIGVPIDEIADLLLREVEGVGQKMAALNLGCPDGASVLSAAAVMHGREENQ